MLWQLGGGLGGLALAGILGDEGLLAATGDASLKLRPDGGLHHAPKAKRVVQFFMSGAASQCDMWDYKPRLIADDGKDWNPGERVELFQSAPGKTKAAPWKWQQYGESGKWLNDCVAPLGEVADEMAFVHNMVAKSNVHGPATFMQATGFVLPGFPSMGAWISYGLGRMTDELPTFVVLPDPRGFAPNGPKNWATAFLPAEHQGTMIQPSATNPINDLFAPASAKYITKSGDADMLAALKTLNQQHERTREAIRGSTLAFVRTRWPHACN